MADPVTRSSRPPSAGKGKEFLGLPAWMWAVGGAAVILGYLYIRSKSSQQPSSSSSGQQHAQGGAGTGWTTDTFKIWVRDHHGKPGPKPGPLPKGDGKGK